jgi:hypothetical protein
MVYQSIINAITIVNAMYINVHTLIWKTSGCCLKELYRQTSKILLDVGGILVLHLCLPDIKAL